MDKDILAIISEKSTPLFKVFNERQKRLWAATEALPLGRGGITAVANATGLCRAAIRQGIKELKEKENLIQNRIRKTGGGKKNITEHHPNLEQDLEQLISPTTRGNPMNPLQWTTKSLRNIVAELKPMGYSIGVTTVRKLLKQKGYSLQANRKTREGEDHPDRDAQFCYINDKAKEFIAEGAPVISVDTKKKENIGNYGNKGQAYQPKGQPIETNMHDFPDKELGKAIPYGIFDIEHNAGFVNVGITSDTAEFAVNSIERWWNEVGAVRFPKDEAGELVRTTNRHPTIEDNVVIYANATILGGKTVIGRDSVIGSSVWLTYSVPAGTTVIIEKPSLKIRNAAGLGD